jgi:CDP-paratose 2-epimerase
LEKELDIKMGYNRLRPRESGQRVFVADASKAKKLIGWQPEIGKSQGVRKMIYWAAKS